MAIAARPPERHETRIVSVGWAQRWTAGRNSGLSSQWNELRAASHTKLWKANGMLTAIGGWPTKTYSSGVRQSSNLTVVRVRLPHLIRLFGGDVQAQACLALLGNGWRGLSGNHLENSLVTARLRSCAEASRLWPSQ